jgi:V/A-type H+-transporting ATPase subunit C
MKLYGGRGNYAYACARIRAKKSLLLPSDAYPKLLMMDLNEIGRFLGEGQYRIEMTELASKYEGVNLIEMGTSRNLARIFAQILGFTKGELREMLAAYFTQWDISNIKTILRGKYYGAPLDDIREDLVAAGELTEEDLNALLTIEGIKEVVEALKRMKDIRIPDDVMAAYEAQGALSPVEDYLDRLYYDRLLERIKGNSKPVKIFLQFVRKQIDHTNIMTLMKLKREGMAPDKIASYLIDGGHEIPMKELARLAAVENFDQLLTELTRFSFFEDIKDDLNRVKETGSLNEVSLAMTRHTLKESEAFSHLHPLSVLPIIDYAIRKRLEVDNIRIVSRGRESGLDADQIKKLLVV